MLERRSSAAHGSARLAERRRLRRRRILIALGILFAFCSAGIVYELNQSAVRIAHVQIFGADQSLAAVALAAMQGTYLGIIPRDSTFFYPAARIRAGILSAYPDIAAVSLFRNGLTSLSIRIDDRVPVARWCPDATRFNLNASSTRLNLVASDAGCYLFDAGGVLYATTSPEQPVNAFVLYEPFADASIGGTLPSATNIPRAFDFARQLGTFGSPVTAVVFTNDEVNDYLASGTRITYVLGNEQNAFNALASARDNFNLANGSVEYVDLRFDGKVYVKPKK